MIAALNLITVAQTGEQAPRRGDGSAFADMLAALSPAAQATESADVPQQMPLPAMFTANTMAAEPQQAADATTMPAAAAESSGPADASTSLEAAATATLPKQLESTAGQPTEPDTASQPDTAAVAPAHLGTTQPRPVGASSRPEIGTLPPPSPEVPAGEGPGEAGPGTLPTAVAQTAPSVRFSAMRDEDGPGTALGEVESLPGVDRSPRPAAMATASRSAAAPAVPAMASGAPTTPTITGSQQRTLARTSAEDAANTVFPVMPAAPSRGDAPAPAAPAIDAVPMADSSAAPVIVPAASSISVAPAPAVAPAAPPAPTQSPTPQPLSTQLSGPVFSLASAGDGEHTMVVRVNPENIGPVTVHAHVRGDNIRVELAAGTDAARDAVRAALVDIRRDAIASGLNADVQLTGRDSGSSTSSNAGGSTPGKGEDRNPRHSAHANSSAPDARKSVPDHRASQTTAIDVLA